MWAFFGCHVIGAVLLATRPNNTYSLFIVGIVLMGRLQDWAVIQAKLRMEEEGISLDYKVD
jgi:hypothetical protein